MALRGKQAAFVAEYLKDRNGTQAAIRAGYSPKTAIVQGSRLLTYADVSGAIAEATMTIREQSNITAQDVALMWENAATTDRNDLMEVRRNCCRFCWSPDHTYQMTPAEFLARTNAHAALLRATPQKEWGSLPPAPVQGVTFDRRKDPSPDCPECFGDGDMHVVIKDTRKLSKGARALYEGVKITKDGIELKVMDRGKAIENLAKHLGMMVDRSMNLNVNMDAKDMPADPVEASKLYQRLTDG